MKYTLEWHKKYYDMNSILGEEGFVYFWKPEERGSGISKACLCQWYSSPFEIDGTCYSCAEQYMMAEKARIFGDDEIREQILKTTEPSEMKKLGKMVRNFIPQVWENLSAETVVRGNTAKFCQNPTLAGFLLLTGHKVLVEASPYDTIWGIGMDEDTAKHLSPHHWKGKNKLGFALMEVRDIIREKLR